MIHLTMVLAKKVSISSDPANVLLSYPNACLSNICSMNMRSFFDCSKNAISYKVNCFTLIIISRLHFGQYSGKFSSTVLSQILILVFLLQLGHNSHSFFFILCFSSDNRISMDNYIYNSRSFHRLVETITHAPTMSTVKTM
jgi:hypothetical protein